MSIEGGGSGGHKGVEKFLHETFADTIPSAVYPTMGESKAHYIKRFLAMFLESEEGHPQYMTKFYDSETLLKKFAQDLFFDHELKHDLLQGGAKNSHKRSPSPKKLKRCPKGYHRDRVSRKCKKALR